MQMENDGNVAHMKRRPIRSRSLPSIQKSIVPLILIFGPLGLSSCKSGGNKKQISASVETAIDGKICGGGPLFSYPVQPGWHVYDMYRIAQLYCGLLDRPPTEAEFVARLNNHPKWSSYEGIADALIDSAEFKEKWGELTDREFLTLMSHPGMLEIPRL